VEKADGEVGPSRSAATGFYAERLREVATGQRGIRGLPREKRGWWPEKKGGASGAERSRGGGSLQRWPTSSEAAEWARLSSRPRGARFQ
jgi:hypothetical protein